MIDHLACHPKAGDEILGTGGVRKLRFSALGSGKRVGARLIHFYGGEFMPVYALLAYAKSARTSLTLSEQRAVRAVVAEIKRAGKERR